VRKRPDFRDIERRDSIQWRAATNFIDGGFELVFDDDSSGEAADLVCLKLTTVR
jgi:hypothetical protein